MPVLEEEGIANHRGLAGGQLALVQREAHFATDAAVVRFRRMLLEAARSLAVTGKEPVAPWQHEAYRVRPGSWTGGDNIGFDEVMLQRFDDPLGRVG